MRNLTLVGLLFVAISASFASWETEEIDYATITNYGSIWTTGLYQNSMVLDSNRLPHVAYIKIILYDGYPRCEIWYCNAYGNFYKEYVGYVPCYTAYLQYSYVPDVALLLDQQENPHIFVTTYDNQTQRSVFHYYKSAGNWTHEPIEYHTNGGPGYANRWLSISARQDSQGYFHVVYAMDLQYGYVPPSGPGYRIRYATNKSGSWSVMDAYYNEDAWIMTGCDLEMNSSDWPSVSFVEKIASDIMQIKYMSFEEYEHSRDYRWLVSTVDDFHKNSEITMLGETQLEISSQGYPVISYFLPSNEYYHSRFMIANRDQYGDWHKSEIDGDSSYTAGEYNSLALKAGDEPDVTYSRQFHLWFGIFDNGSWDLSCAQSDYQCGFYNHLVLDPTDDGWYITHVCNSAGYSHLFIKWWDPVKMDNKLARQQKRPSFSINSIYPLPANDCINCTYSASQSGLISMNLYDLSGRLVSKGMVSNHAGDGVFTYDVSHLATGIYTVRASSAGLVSNKKIIVAH